MTEQEELIMLRALVEKQKQEIAHQQKEIEKRMKQFADRISRSKVCYRHYYMRKSRDLDVRQKQPSFRDN